MANIKKGARAYYADTDYRRDGMNEAYSKIDSMPSIPTPTAEDVGKVVKATENGGYTLAQDAGTVLPDITTSDNTSIIDVENGSWTLKKLTPSSFVVTDGDGYLQATRQLNYYVSQPTSTVRDIYFAGNLVSWFTIQPNITSNPSVLVRINDKGTYYTGFGISMVGGALAGVCFDSDNNPYKFLWNSTTITVTPVGSIKTFVVTIAGTTVVLPQGCDYTLLSSLISNGVEVILTDDISLYKASKIDSIAETLLFNCMTISSGTVEVKQITVGADGTNTLETVTLS